MISLLGKQRVILLGLFIVFNAALGWLYLGILKPGLDQSERQTTNVERQIRSVRSDLNGVQVALEQLDGQINQFDALSDLGFFDQSQRSKATDLFLEIQGQTNVVAKVNVGKGEVIESPEADKADNVLLKSRVAIEVSAMTDVDVFQYILEMQRRFPGYIDVKSITLERTKDVTRPLLQSIIAGDDVELVAATLVVDWMFMIPRDEVIETEDDQNGGRR